MGITCIRSTDLDNRSSSEFLAVYSTPLSSRYTKVQCLAGLAKVCSTLVSPCLPPGKLVIKYISAFNLQQKQLILVISLGSFPALEKVLCAHDEFLHDAPRISRRGEMHISPNFQMPCRRSRSPEQQTPHFVLDGIDTSTGTANVYDLFLDMCAFIF